MGAIAQSWARKDEDGLGASICTVDQQDHVNLSRGVVSGISSQAAMGGQNGHC